MNKHSSGAPRSRKRFQQIGLVAGSAFAALLALEVAVRIFWQDPGAGELEQLTDGRQMILRAAENRELDYELTPNARGFAWGAQVRVNSHGQRGPEVELAKGNRFRVAVIGDSIAFGNRLPEGLVFPYRLAAMLEEHGPGAYDVLNFAVGGYDVVQEVASVEQKAMAFQPDLVVLAWCLNDAGVMSVNREYLARVQAQWRSPLFDSHLFRFVSSLLGARELQEATELANDPVVFAARYRDHIDAIGAGEEVRRLMAAAPRQFVGSWYGDEDRVGRIRHSFAKLAELSAQGGFEVLVLVIPWLEWEDGEYPYRVAHQIVELEAERAGFPVMDVTERFMEHETDSLRVKVGDPAHPNQDGHKILAEALRDYIVAR